MYHETRLQNMIVRIRFAEGRAVRKQSGKNRHLALAGNAVMIPTSLMAYVLGFWRLSSDLGITKPFAVSGIFSHWQFWMIIGASLQISARRLMRYGSTEPAEAVPAESLSSKAFRHHA
jgi:hypothetical protein